MSNRINQIDLQYSCKEHHNIAITDAVNQIVDLKQKLMDAESEISNKQNLIEQLRITEGKYAHSKATMNWMGNKIVELENAIIGCIKDLSIRAVLNDDDSLDISQSVLDNMHNSLRECTRKEKGI